MQFELEPDDVISTDIKIDEVLSAPTFQFGQLKAGLLSRLSINLKTWLGEGMSCRLLRPGQGWQSGTARMILVFEPDDVDEDELDELDELRTEKPPG